MKVPKLFAFGTIACFVVAAFLLVNAQAERATTPPKHIWTQDQCLKCHRDEKTIMKIQDKQGDKTFAADVLSEIQAQKRGQKCPVKS